MKISGTNTKDKENLTQEKHDGSSCRKLQKGLKASFCQMYVNNEKCTRLTKENLKRDWAWVGRNILFVHQLIKDSLGIIQIQMGF